MKKFTFETNNRFLTYGFYCIAFGISIGAVMTIAGNFITPLNPFSPELLALYGTFIGGTVGTLFSLGAYFLIFENFRQTDKQHFESLYFNLFQIFNEFRLKQIELEISIEPHTIKYVGTDFFRKIFEFQLGIQKVTDKVSIADIQKVFEIHKIQLAYYFGHINAILNHIDSNRTLSEKEKIFYLDYLKNLLSEHEIFLILQVEKHPYSKRFPLLKKYDLSDGQTFDSVIKNN